MRDQHVVKTPGRMAQAQLGAGGPLLELRLLRALIPNPLILAVHMHLGPGLCGEDRKLV